MRRLKLLEEEKRELKRLVADLSLDKHILQDVLAKKSEACSAARDCPVCSIGSRGQRAAQLCCVVVQWDVRALTVGQGRSDASCHEHP